MNLKVLWSLVGAVTVVLGWFAFEFLRFAPGREPLVEYTYAAVGIAIGLGIFWGLYSLLIAYLVVPKADAFIDPHQPGDDLIFRHLRALNYGGACTFQWANRRTLDFDCRRLPTEIRYPLKVHFIALLTTNVLGFGGGAVLWAMGRL